jgi:hypothetical protein
VSSPFRLLMISAMYENGGNLVHRLLDGHPQMFVYPFESQLGTRMVVDLLSSVFPVKYRWPQFAIDATPEEHYHAIIDEETKIRTRTPAVSKFRHFPMQLDDAERRRAFADRVKRSGGRRSDLVEAFFRATFDVWRDYRGSGAERWFVGYSPIVGIDTAQILADIPGAHVLHVVRNPWSAYADTKRRPVPMRLADYCTAWSLVQQRALLFSRRFPDRCTLVRTEDVMDAPEKTLSRVCERLGLAGSSSLSTPSWNGVALATLPPWGTVQGPSPIENRQRALELSDAERDEVAEYTSAYLTTLEYDQFLSTAPLA